MTTHATILPRAGILDIAPYKGGESSVPGANRVYKLSSNENPLGPSPKAVEAYRAASDTLASYPDGGATALRRAIADVHGIDAGRIVCGAGSDELIALLCRAYAGPGDEVLYSEHGFLMYAINARIAGAATVVAKETAYTASVDAMLAACTDATRLVFIANPNNPTGTLLPSAEIARLAEGIPPKALLVLDSAYAECVREPDYDAGEKLVDARDNVVMLRTFSKVYGLAALRLGWAYGPEHVVSVLNRVRGPFNVTAAALAAGEAAMRDRDWIEHCVITNEVWRGWLEKEITAAGLTVTPSHANFILVHCPAEGPHTAPALDAALRARGVIARRVDGYGLPNSLRITVGDEEACRAVAGAVRGFMAGVTA